MYPYVYCSIVYNNQDMEATQASISRQKDKDDAVHINNGILHIHKNWGLIICDTMDGPRGCMLS